MTTGQQREQRDYCRLSRKQGLRAERDWGEMRESTPIPQALCLRAGGWTEPGLVWDVLGWRCLENIQVMWLAVSLETDRKVYRFLMDFLNSLVTSVNVANERN